MNRKTKADPTGQAVNRNKGTRQLSARLNRAERRIRALFRSIPKTSSRQTQIVNADQITIYEYQYDQEQFDRMVEFILDDELLQTQTDLMPFEWFWKDDVELVYRQGTLEEFRDFNELVIAAIAAGVLINGLPPQTVPVESALLTENYRTALRNTQVSHFNSIKGMSEKTATQVLQRINSGIQAGATPTVITNDISARFDVARSDAKRISETAINQAYNDAKLDATRLLGNQTGLRAAVIHISALSTTTRPHHADRHGNAYTVNDQLSWWNEGANRINCKCTTRSVLIDSGGKVIQSDLQDDIKNEGDRFFNR